jgi:hypothetical protein
MCLGWHSSRGSVLAPGVFPLAVLSFTSYKFSAFYFSKFELSAFMQQACADIICSYCVVMELCSGMFIIIPCVGEQLS